MEVWSWSERIIREMSLEKALTRLCQAIKSSAFLAIRNTGLFGYRRKKSLPKVGRLQELLVLFESLNQPNSLPVSE
jgi:hypothetical protein